MKIVYAASECAPFIKSGGLGDVIGALPKALVKQGVAVSVILPKYGDLPSFYKEQMEFVKSIQVPVGWRQQYCGVFRLEANNVTYYFLDNEYYFKRHGSYGFYDDGERFAFFSRAVLEVLPLLPEKPDVIHCHDWQTGPISALLKAHYANHPYYNELKTIFTIHNLQYQGIFPKNVLHDLLDLSELYFTQEGLEFYGNVSYMKAGLAFSDKLTTVSPSYAEEIQTAYYGERLDGFLRKRRDHLIGIINGIDETSYDPETDTSLYHPYQTSEGKAINKSELQRELGLKEQAAIPLIGMVTRLVEQKGLELVLHVIHEILQQSVQLVILGTGDETFEQAFHSLSRQYPDRFVFCCYFDDTLARRIYAGADLFLMPSKFEPCGIGQLLAMRYGTLPIVRETGGLKDTVQPYNELNDEGNGFSFTHYNAHDMLHTIERALWVYTYQPQKWKVLVNRAMQLDFSWEQSAGKYKEIYQEVIEAPSKEIGI